MDRYLISGALLALVIEVLVLFADLRWVDLPYFSEASVNTKTVIGHVEVTRQNVRRRKQTAIAWDRSEVNDPLFGFDSVLTLKESSAILNLDGGIKLNLDENTLVILEPRSQDSQDKTMRLKFSKGGLRAKTGAQDLDVALNEWTLDAKRDSEINVRGLNDGRFDVEVLGGEVLLRSGDKTETIRSGTRVDLKPNGIGKTESIDSSLKWAKSMNDRFERHYSHEMPMMVTLEWQGSANLLRHLGPEKIEKEIPLENGINKINLVLSPGSHTFTLARSDKISSSHEVQIWRAPVLRHYSPLPRDRVKTGNDSIFSWSPIESAQRYRWQASESESFGELAFEFETDSTFRKFSLSREGDFFWRVQATDGEGFEIPSFYKTPVYSVADPLAAPRPGRAKLRAPAGEKPAPKNRSRPTSYFRIIYDLAIETVSADDKPSSPERLEVEFNWSTVDEADHYLIEISKSPDFLDPVIIAKTKTPHFIWREAGREIYYWRVAAGLGYRRGLFSEAVEIDLRSPVLDRENDDGVTVRNPPAGMVPVKKQEPIKPELKEEPAAERPSEPPPKSNAVMAEAEPTPEPKGSEASETYGGEFFFNGSYQTRSFQGDPDFKGTMTGLGAMKVDIRLTRTRPDGESLSFDFEFQSVKWKNKSTNEFQSDLTERDYAFEARTGSRETPWSLGARIAQTSREVRDDYEALKLEPHIGFGPALIFQKNLSSSSSTDFRTHLLYGDQALTASARARYKHGMSGTLQDGWSFATGLGLNYERGPASRSSLTIELSLGVGRSW